MSYDPSSTNSRDLIRGLLWDTDDDAPLREDALYDALIAAKGFAYCVAFLAQSFRSEYSRKMDSFSKSGGIAVSWRARDANWGDLVTRYGWALDADIAPATAGVIGVGVVTYPGDPYDAETVGNGFIRW